MASYALRVLDCDPNILVNDFIEMLPELEDDIVTAAEQLMAKGMQKGMQEGEQAKALEIARNMLKLQADIEFVAKATGLSKEIIEALAQTLSHEQA